MQNKMLFPGIDKLFYVFLTNILLTQLFCLVFLGKDIPPGELIILSSFFTVIIYIITFLIQPILYVVL